MGNSLDPVTLTQKLLAFDTINPPGHEADCAGYLGDLLREAGFRVAYHEFGEGRTSLVARLGGEDKPLCFTGHIDTVPLGSQRWSRDPFAGEIHDDKLYGRGSSDMKSGVAAFVVAAIESAAERNDDSGVVLVITAGEETGCEGAQHLTETDDALGSAGAVVVGEPTSNYPLIGHKGVLWLHAHTRGVTAHGSMPEQGVNAIYKAARVVSRLEQLKLEAQPHPVLGSPTLNVGTISGGLNINSVPDGTRIGIDIRTIPGMDHGELRDSIGRYLAPDLDELETFVDLEGIWTDPEHPWTRSVFDIVADITGDRPTPNSATYFTDASVLTTHFRAPAIVLGPGEARMAHQTDEYCHVTRIRQAAELYSAILKDWRNH